MRERFYTLTASCPDRTGIIAKVSGFIADLGGWLLESAYHADAISGQYFMRMEIRADTLACGLPEFSRRFADEVATPLSMRWKISDSAVQKRIVILVSQAEHCLYDLLSRWRATELNIVIPCVISNHEKLRGFVEWHGIPFHHVPMPAGAEGKAQGFAEIRRLFEAAEGDVMVLARYMQILPPELCAAYPERILNIHHSFLPSFAGAKPYHQAYERGVKLIGATCHYATADLDQGPIIEQDVIRIDHTDSPEDMVRYGKDIEKTVLARALRYHLEDRVLTHGNKTVVFR
ncbi:MAG: formyltetrahydrofolate deformylase [Zoogloeaceae bacterium]|jgi:formyltetrahydrofolate deformylase|nr:formyltetrahydrofolate deformylase [Zoogloeaceae bacterium]